MRGRTICALAALLLPLSALADEIRLKDGTKIMGTIVGFEDNSFKVQTSYGFALVRKDKIAAIIPSEPKPEPKKEPATESKKPADQEAQAPPATPLAGVNPERPAATGATPPPAPAPARPPAAAAKKNTPTPVAAKVTLPPAPPPTTPKAKDTPPTALPAISVAPPSAALPALVAQLAATPPRPAEPAIREEVQGNLYINHTYGFRMYKPPSWHVIEGAQKALPTAIVAMGTGDETTLLVVGRERLKDSLDAHAAATERQLREIYENYRRLSEQRSRIAGLVALERRYRGTVAGHDWSGVVLSLARGGEVFTILGTTYADSDLIQIQENVIARTIASLEFTSR